MKRGRAGGYDDGYDEWLTPERVAPLDLKAGDRVFGHNSSDGNLAPPDMVRQVGIGTRVRMVFSDVTEGLSLPQWTMRLPILSRIGFAAANASSLPPHMNVRVPALAPWGRWRLSRRLWRRCARAGQKRRGSAWCPRVVLC